MWLAQHRWISLLHPILEGPCIGQGLLRLSLSKVLAGEHWVLRWQGFLLADELGGWWCQIVVFDILGFALFPGDFKRGPYLPSKLLEVVYPWDSCQLPLPVGCVEPMSPPHYPLFILFCQGLLQEITPPPSFCMAASSHRKHWMSGSSFGKGPRSRSVEGCPAAWSSSDIYSGSWKVTGQCDPVGLCIGDQAWLHSSGGALQCLWLCPWGLFLGWSWLWEWWQMSGLVLVVD